MEQLNNVVIKNAVIESATLGFERGVFLTSWLNLDYGDSMQGFGGWALGNKLKIEYSGHAEVWIKNILKCADVDNWGQLAGRSIRAICTPGWDGKVIGIRHFLQDDIEFIPQEVFSKIQRSENYERSTDTTDNDSDQANNP